MKTLFAILGMAMLAACASTPSRTLLALSKFDLLTADYAQIGARIEHPSGVEIRPGDAMVIVRVAREDGERMEATLPLTATVQAAASDPDRTVTDFTMAPTEIAQIEAFRAGAEAWEANGHEIHGSVTVSVKGCKSGTLPEGPLLASVQLKLTDETGYLPLRDGVDLRDLAKAHQGAAGVDSCSDS